MFFTISTLILRGVRVRDFPLRYVLPLSDCSWWNPWPSLSEIYFFHTPVFPAPRRPYNSFIARAMAVRLLSLHPCLPACSYLPYWCFPHLHWLFLSLDHLLHLIIPPPGTLISWGSPPGCNAQHLVSYSQNRRAPLLPPSCTLSTGVTFFNTVSLSFILGLSSFNLHHFIIGVACSGVQRFLP